MSKAGLLQIGVLRDTDTSNRVALTVLWIIFFFFVLINWFCCTDSVKKERNTVLSSCVSMSRNISLAPVWEKKVHHRYQLPDF